MAVTACGTGGASGTSATPWPTAHAGMAACGPFGSTGYVVRDSEVPAGQPVHISAFVSEFMGGDCALTIACDGMRLSITDAMSVVVAATPRRACARARPLLLRRGDQYSGAWVWDGNRTCNGDLSCLTGPVPPGEYTVAATAVADGTTTNLGSSKVTLLDANATPTAKTEVAYAATVLLEALPSADPTQAGGMTRFTAAELTRLKQGAQFGNVAYVTGDVASADPELVSVNPIDAYTWGAAAYSTRLQRCIVVVESHDRTNPQYGGTYWGVLAPGAPCVGTAATVAVATSPNQPQE